MYVMNVKIKCSQMNDDLLVNFIMQIYENFGNGIMKLRALEYSDLLLFMN